MALRLAASYVALDNTMTSASAPKKNTRRQLASVFEPFVQFGRNIGGAGLGLTLSREIVERHGGRIEVASQRGQGARFTVSLPWPSAVPSS